MTPAVVGALIGAAAGLGLLLVAGRMAAIRRPSLAVRVLPYLRDLPDVHGSGARLPLAAGGGAGGRRRDALLAPLAVAVERVLGGSASVRRRLDRAGLDTTVHQFRVEQVVWGLIGFAVATGYGVLQSLAGATEPVSLLVVAGVAFVAGVLLRDNRLTATVKTRERRILAEFPTVAELLALAVAAGEGPVAALARVTQRSDGALSHDLGHVLAAIRTGEPVGAAFDRLAATTGLPLVARFAQGVAIAVERGTPLADVLHAQAADVREAGRRELIEVAARREVAMMVPVVFLVLPVTVMFAFWPGLIGLSLSAS